MSEEKKQTFDKQLENGNKYFYCLYIQLESAQRPLTCCFWQHFAAFSQCSHTGFLLALSHAATWEFALKLKIFFRSFQFLFVALKMFFFSTPNPLKLTLSCSMLMDCHWVSPPVSEQSLLNQILDERWNIFNCSQSGFLGDWERWHTSNHVRLQRALMSVVFDEKMSFMWSIVFSSCLTPVSTAGQAAGATAWPGSNWGTRQTAEQRASASTVCQPSQCDWALDPDQDGGLLEF